MCLCVVSMVACYMAQQPVCLSVCFVLDSKSQRTSSISIECLETSVCVKRGLQTASCSHCWNPFCVAFRIHAFRVRIQCPKSVWLVFCVLEKSLCLARVDLGLGGGQSQRPLKQEICRLKSARSYARSEKKITRKILWCFWKFQKILNIEGQLNMANKWKMPKENGLKMIQVKFQHVELPP